MCQMVLMRPVRGELTTGSVRLEVTANLDERGPGVCACGCQLARQEPTVK